MDAVRRDLSQVLGRIGNVARERAPVAAEFEYCSQRFDRLSTVMEANELTWEPYQILLNDYRSRLATWGSDTGARSRTIDYTLRKSSRLQSQALELLEHLHGRLQNSMWYFSYVPTLGVEMRRAHQPACGKFALPVGYTPVLVYPDTYTEIERYISG